MALTKRSKRRASKPTYTREVLVVHSKSWKQEEQVVLGVGVRNTGRPVKLEYKERELAGPAHATSSRKI